jgi:hypothetical protein
MTRRIICLLIAAASVIGVVPLFAQERATAAAGTLPLDKKTYTLKRVLAYETTIDDEAAIAVVLSGQPVSNEMLKEARDAEKEGGDRFQAAIPPAGVQEDGGTQILERGCGRHHARPS